MKIYKQMTTYKVNMEQLHEIFENDSNPEYWQHLNLQHLNLPEENTNQEIFLEFNNNQEPINITIFTPDTIYTIDQEFENYARLFSQERNPPTNYEIL